MSKKTPYQETLEKYQQFGDFCYTAQDHENIGSSAPQILKENPGKAYYEVVDEEMIADNLDFSIELIKSRIRKCDTKSADHEKNYLLRSIEFLKSVDKLPERYRNFTIDQI